MRVLPFVALVVAPAFALAQREASLVGSPAPEIQTRDFLQSDGRTAVADYKGEVLLVEKFATWCGPCVGMMPHLVKLKEEYGEQGFNVLSITNEPRDTVLKFFTQLNVTAINYTMGCGGGAEAYPAPGIPKAFLVDVEGKVVWEGHPAELTNKMIETELKKIVPSPERRAASAERGLAWAETLLGEKQVLRATGVLARIVKQHKGTPAATKAAARLTEIEKDPALAPELAAQKSLDKLVGGLELPAEKLKKKERESTAEKVAALAKKIQADAPGTAKLAQQWEHVLREDWDSGH